MAFAYKPPSQQRGASKPMTANPTTCGYCGEKDNFHDSAESGDRSCANCGTVLQENNIVSTVQFSESGGSSNVVGQFVSGDKGRPSGGGAGRGRGRFGQSRDSRETTIQNGKKKIIQVCGECVHYLYVCRLSARCCCGFLSRVGNMDTLSGRYGELVELVFMGCRTRCFGARV